MFQKHPQAMFPCSTASRASTKQQAWNQKMLPPLEIEQMEVQTSSFSKVSQAVPTHQGSGPALHQSHDSL